MLDFIEIKTKKEIENLAKLAKEIWEEYWPCLLMQAQIDFMVNKFQSFEAIGEQIENEGYIYKLVAQNNKILGYFGVAPKNKKCWGGLDDKIEDYLFLSKLYIKEGKRGQGIGKEAFLEIVRLAKEKGLKSIYLTVNKHNLNTIEAYKKWGFKTVETAETCIGKGFIMDDYIMKFEV